MIVVFVRHGIAHRALSAETDAERALTAEGQRKMHRIAQGLKRLVSDWENAWVWSSPLLRARQTADILADCLKSTRAPREQPFLAQPEWQGPAAALRALPGNATVFMVGHEPYLGDWCKELCGARLLFRRGAAAAVDLPDGPDHPGSLLWFAQPRMLQMIRSGDRE